MNKFAISSGGIGEAMMRSASSLDAANNSIDESIALITAANTVVQNPDKVGNAFKTISMRIRGAKTELEEAGESTEGMAESTASMRKEIMALSGVDIMLNENTFKSTYQVMDELSHKWEDLSDIAQASIIELMAGKHQGNVFASLMSNFDIAREALEVSANSAGSAMEEHAKWSQSLEARLLKLKATWQSLAQSFMSSDFLGNLLDGVTSLVNALDWLIDKFGALPTLFGALAGGMSLFKKDGFKGFFTFDKDSKSIQLFNKELKGFGSNLLNLGRYINDYNALSSKGVGIQSTFVGSVSDTNSSLGKYLSGLNGAKASMGGYISSLVGATLKTFALQAATVALNAALTMGVSFLISAAVSAISKWMNAEEDLAEKVSEVTSKYKEKHEELKKIQSDYDTSNESSMINKYAELSKGVDGLGKNVSLTAQEYSEYQGIVDTIAGQIPSLVSGYDSQGNAILSCKGNVEALTEAYEKLIHTQNQEVLTNTGNIEKDFENTLKNAEKGSFLGIGKDVSTPSIELLEKVLNGNYSAEEIERLLKDLSLGQEDGVYEALYNAGIGDMGRTYNTKEIAETLSKQLKDDKSKIKGIIDDYYSQFNDAVEEQKTIAQAVLSEAFDVSGAISGLDYGNISEELQSIAQQTINSLDYDFFENLSKNGISVEQWTKEMLSQLNSLSDVDNKQIEAGFELQTKFNGGDISYGDYVGNLKNLESTIDGLDLKDEVKEQLKLSLNTEEITKEYDSLKKRLTSKEYGIKMSADEAEEFLSELNANEYAVFVDLVASGEIDLSNFNTDSLSKYIEEQAKLQEAMNFTIAMDVETESMGAFNTALTESVSAVGLSSASIEALKGRYAELAEQGYDLSSMFEETSNGIHLNRNAVDEFERTLASNKLSETEGHLDTLKGRYDDLTEEIKNCTDAGKRANLYSEQQQVAQKINDLATLASQYEGLTSAYNAWQSAESAGNERDMYENIISGFETIEDEISRGWYDDGTIKFLELMTGQTDLAGKSASELKKIWNSLDDTIKGTSYSVKDFFTTNEDGESTSTGAYNFLRAVEELGKNGGLKALKGKNINELVERNSEGKIVSFDFDVVGGDKAVAEALGVSEEMVQIIQRTLDDAGFVVTLDGKYTLLADLKTSAEEANNSLKKLQSEGLKNLKDLDLNFDFDVNTVEGYQEQLEKALNVLDKFRNKDGTLQTDKNGNLVKGAKEALEVAEYYTAAMDKLTEPKIMQIDTSTVDEELQDPIEKMQTIGDLCKEKHLVSLTGDTEEINKVQGEIDKVAKEIKKLDPEIKAKIGIDEDWDAKTIADKIEKGEIEVPAELKLDVQMSEDLKDMRLLMMRQLGLVSEEEVKLKVGYEIDESTVDNLTPDEQKVVVEFISENEDWFGKLTDDKKKIAIELVTSGVDLDSLTDDKKKEVVIEFVTKNKDEFDKLSDEEKQVVIDIVTDDKALEALEGHSVEIEAFANIFGVEKVDDLKKKLDGLDDTQIQVFTKVIGQIDVEKLKSTIAGLDDKTVQAIAEALGKGDVDGLKTTINGLDDKTVQAIAEAFGYSDVNELNSAIDNLDPKTVEAIAKALGITDVDSLRNAINRLKDKDVEAVAKVKGKDKVDSLKTSLSNLKDKTVNVVINTFKKFFGGGGESSGGGGEGGGGVVNGTANVNGTTGRAYKNGSWGAKNSGTALMGELGREIIVRDGKWFTVGDSGAGFYRYEKGDIIFNHKQTEELFKNGKVTSGGGRAKSLVNGTAYVDGTAYAEGTAFAGGMNSVTGKTYKKASERGPDEFEETFDWIEIAIDRIERAIDLLDIKATSIYKNWTTRNNNLVKEIGKVGEEIKLQQDAYDKYIAAANAVGLDESYAKLVRNGSIDISTVYDEVLAQKINDYKELYEKALDCRDAVEELKEKESELYALRVEYAATKYEGMLGIIEHEKNMIEQYISQTEANAMLVSANYYKGLMSSGRKNIDKLEKQRAEMLEAFNTAMDSGKIDKYSESYYEMVNSIDEVTLAIEESNTALLEYEQTLQQLNWEVFDILQERISGVTEETEFLIDLMSNSKLYNDKGQLTDEGSATMGLHGQNYNVYMNQADRYRQEVEELNKELEKDPYDQDLINRRDKLLDLQRKSILAAEKEKESIRDMVEEGIELELDALQELIDKKNEQLKSEKDLYDYQKKVKEQAKEIASIEKQLAAYAGDDSEESKAKIQELKVSLEEAKSDLQETEYDKYVSDQEQLLDNLYLDYETILNTRLDNVDALLSDMITEINTDASMISSTLSEKADSVGYTLSESMKTIWNENSVGTRNVITTYGDKFITAQTTTNNALNAINANLQSMIASLNKSSSAKVKSVSTSSVANSNKSNQNNKTPNNSNNNKPKTSTFGSDGIPKLGDKVKFVSGQYYYDSQGKKPLGSQKQGQYVYITNINKKDWATHPYHISTGKLLGDGDLGWLKLNQISGYATGKKKFNNNEIAWTQENGKEYIIRPSDGAILTPIAKGDSVLTSAASNNIWNMANSPTEFIKDNLNLGTANIPNNSNVQNNITQNLENVVFSLPNVQNYEQLLSSMQKDKNFEKLILSMSIDRLAGKSSLAKNKSIR